MTWHLKWGEHVKAFEQRAKKTGVVPPPLRVRPTLKPQDAIYMSAFSAVSRSRPIGMSGVGPVPVSEVLAYCELLGIANLAARAKYLGLVQDLDSIYMDAQYSKQAARS